MSQDLKEIIDSEDVTIKPSQKEKILKEFFDLQLVETAHHAFKSKEYLKSAMISWSYIEEFFLPTSIKYIAKRQKVRLDKDFLSRITAYQLIRYYFLISYDRKMYDLLEQARKYRNDLMHNIYRSASLIKIEEKSKISARYNLTLLDDMFDRQEGKIVVPSLKIYFDARNDLRKEMRKKIKAL